MQAGLGWAKKKGNNNHTQGPSLTEIQVSCFIFNIYLYTFFISVNNIA